MKNEKGQTLLIVVLLVTLLAFLAVFAFVLLTSVDFSALAFIPTETESVLIVESTATEIVVSVENTQTQVPSPVVPTIASTDQPTSTPTSTPEPTPTVPTSTPSFTPLPTLTPTVTITPTPEMLDDGREWTRNQFGIFMAYVGGHIMFDPNYPQSDPVIDSLLPSLRDCYPDDDACDAWTDHAYTVGIPPAYWCEWSYQAALKGYGMYVILGDEVEHIYSEQEMWESYRRVVATEEEPYCPQFVP